MHVRRRLIPLVLLLVGASAAGAESTFRFPCDPELSPILSVSEHEITSQLDLARYYRELADNFETEIMPVESGTILLLDDELMLFSIRYSSEFDFEANYWHLPERLTLFNFEPYAPNDTGTPHWQVTLYPDQDDPYAFHYVGTWNASMAGFTLYGEYRDPQGVFLQAFSFRVSVR